MFALFVFLVELKLPLVKHKIKDNHAQLFALGNSHASVARGLLFIMGNIEFNDRTNGF